MNIIYLRISKDTSYQDTAHQLESCKSFAEKNDISIDKVIKDEGISAFSKDISDREGFTEIIHLAEQNKLENLIVFETSRISRRYIQGLTIIDELTNRGVKIWSVVDNACVNQNELDQLFNAFKFWMNQKASKETSARVKSQKKMAKEQGLYLGGKILFGFEVRDKKLVPKEEMKIIVEKMFDWYIQFGNKRTMELLTEHGYPISLHQILLQRLSNPRYIEIIGQAKFNQVQKIIQSRRCVINATNIRTNKSKQRYEGLLFHAECNSKLNIEKNNRGFTSFRCKVCRGNDSIKVKKSFSAKAIQNNLDKEIIEILDTLDHDKLKERYENKCGKNKSILNYQINELNNLLKSKEKTLKLANEKLEKYIMQNVSDNIIESISNVISKLKSEINEIDTEVQRKNEIFSSIINEEQHQEQMIQKILDIKEIYKSADTEKQKAILNLLIDRVVVRDTNDFDIYLNI